MWPLAFAGTRILAAMCACMALSLSLLPHLPPPPPPRICPQPPLTHTLLSQRRPRPQGQPLQPAPRPKGLCHLELGACKLSPRHHLVITCHGGMETERGAEGLGEPPLPTARHLMPATCQPSQRPAGHLLQAALLHTRLQASSRPCRPPLALHTASTPPHQKPLNTASNHFGLFTDTLPFTGASPK